jgi:hypothetical protein
MTDILDKYSISPWSFSDQSSPDELKEAACKSTPSYYKQQEWQTVIETIPPTHKKTSIPIIYKDITFSIIKAVANYKANSSEELSETKKGFKFVSEDNRKLLQQDLQAFRLVKERLDDRQFCLKILSEFPANEIFGIDIVSRVISVAESMISKNFTAAHKEGSPPQHARRVLINEISEIWAGYTGRKPTVSKNINSFMKFTHAVADPILEVPDIRGFDSAMLQIRGEELKRLAELRLEFKKSQKLL